MQHKVQSSQQPATPYNGQPADPNSAGGAVEHLMEIPRNLIRIMNGIIQRMTGGFDLQITPMWDAGEMVKRMLTHRSLDPARKYEEGRPALTLACDISGSCADISRETTAIAVASTWSGEFQSDIWCFKHDNGALYWHDTDIDPHKEAASNKSTLSLWTWRNGTRVPLKSAVVAASDSAKNSTEALRMVMYGVHGKANIPALSGVERLLLINSNRSSLIDPRDHPVQEQPTSYLHQYAVAADIMLINAPQWVVVFTDTDGVSLLRALLAYTTSATNIAWVDYRTIPNRLENGKWRTLRQDGLTDNRFSRYGIIGPHSTVAVPHAGPAYDTLHPRADLHPSHPAPIPHHSQATTHGCRSGSHPSTSSLTWDCTGEAASL